MSIVADNTRRIMEEKCFKQRLVAQKANFKEREFSALLTGRKIIRDTHIIRIAAALGVTPGDLLRPPQ